MRRRRTRRAWPRPPGYGYCRIGYYNADTGEKQYHALAKNDWMYTHGYISAQALGRGNVQYQLGTLYFEYQNVAAPGNTVTPPTVSRGDTLEYYESLSGLPNTDFLRVPILASPNIVVANGYQSLLSANQGNQLVLSARSQLGVTTGIFGRPFSHTANSVVYGVAVVATPNPQDWTQDLLFAR